MNGTVYRFSAQPEELDIPRREALRYLGCRGEADADLLALVEACERELRAALTLRACFTRVTVDFPAEHLVRLDGYEIESRNLALNLRGCGEAFLFASTLGAGVDRLIARAGRISAARGVVTDALASAAAESWCAQVNAKLDAGELFLRPRYSPGYGDVALEHQVFFLKRLDTARQIGLSVTAAGMMTPVKSVTAVAGLSPTPVRCKAQTGCAACGLADCPYRK